MPHTILLADDSKTIQRAVDIVFEKEADFTVVKVQDGEAAVAKAKEVGPAVVIVDHALAGKDGYQVAEALKADPSTAHVKVLLLSGSSAPFDEPRATGAGAGNLQKPFDCQSLYDKVAVLCGLKAAADVVPASPFAHLKPASSGSAPIPQAAAPAPAAQPPPAAQPAPGVPAFAAAAPASASSPGLPRPPTPAASPFGGPPAAAPAAEAPRRMDPFGFGGGDAPAQPAPVASQPAPAAAPQPFGGGLAGAVAERATATVEKRVDEVASAAVGANGAAPSSPSRDAISAATREIIERVVWEVVPELAETLIREEIERLLRDRQG